jgi:hypothetical protein
MTTPHQRRVLELEALRGVIADLEALIAASKGTVPTAAVATAFEHHSSALPEGSALLGMFSGLAAKLRAETSPQLAESGVRRITVRLRQRQDDLGRWVERRGARLDAKQGRSN